MHNWHKVRVSPTFTVEETLRIIDATSDQIALVVDARETLLGIVTDGDVRRGILRGVPLNAPVTDIMKRGCKVMEADMPLEQVYAAMMSLGVRHMPLVTKSGTVVGLHVLEEMLRPQNLDCPVVVMAGGLGTRLRPLTEHIPKPMLRIGGRPILHTLLERMIAAGLKHFHFSVNYKAEVVREYFGNGEQWGVSINYLEETERRGTAGALTGLNIQSPGPVLVINGDVLTKVNFKALLDFHAALKSAATMCIREFTVPIPFGVVDVEDYVVKSIREKPNQRFFVNAGIYVLNSDVCSLIPDRGQFDMPSLMDLLLKQDRVVTSFPVREYWMDIGRLDDFSRASDEYEDVFPES